jgi:ElaA protein
MDDERRPSAQSNPGVAIARPEWQWARLDTLPATDLYAALMLRQQVFVVEQQCPFLDADGLDAPAWHLLGWIDRHHVRSLGAYLRVIDPGAKYREPSLGRIVTAPAIRRTGVGRLLVAEGIARTSTVHRGMPIRIGAQRYLEAFYAQFGFRTVSAPYDEDGIEHVEMLRDAGATLR